MTGTSLGLQIRAHDLLSEDGNESSTCVYLGLDCFMYVVNTKTIYRFGYPRYISCSI